MSAAVHSRSAVGEQFLELTPRPDTESDSPKLRDGDVIPVGRVQVPVDIGKLLEAAADVQKVLGRPLGSHVLVAGPVDWHRE